MENMVLCYFLLIVAFLGFKTSTISLAGFGRGRMLVTVLFTWTLATDAAFAIHRADVRFSDLVCESHPSV